MKRILIALLTLCAVPAAAQAPAAQANTAVGSVRPLYGQVAAYVLAAAEQMPEAEYGFKPTPEVRSFGQLVGHIANAQHMICAMAMGEQSQGGRAEIGVALDPPEGYRHPFQELVVVDPAQALPAAAAEVERALLRWLECRVERRYPDAVIGENPLAARLLQFLRRHRLPLASDLVQTLLNCAIQCRVRSPILMPHPHGIVIHRHALIGSRVTVMHQVTIGTQHPADSGAPIIEDNVYIGAGAKVLGAIRVGRGATVGANAVVTRDVPSHCTVVGVNRILGGPAVVRERHPEHALS